MAEGTVLRRILTGLALSLVPLAAGVAHAAPADAGLVVERVVLVMRHGVRPPTKAPAMPAGIAAQAWPAWPVAPGWLTPHGGLAVERLGAADGRWLRARSILPPRGCPQAGSLRILADSDQRTIATAEHWRAGIAPGCTLAEDHRPQGEEDPRFNPLGAGLARLDPAQAMAGVQQAVGAGGLAGLDAAYRPLLARLDAILCGAARGDCGLAAQPTDLAPAKADGRPRLTGALDRGSTAAQILLLEYAEGKTMDQVGWGRASAADIAALSALHALEFRLLARPQAIASANLAGLKPVIREGLTGPVRLTMIVGHDTNVANLGGLLGVHWHVPGFAPDDPAPGGALLLEMLRGRDGRGYVRAAYRAQTLEQIRAARPLAAAWRMNLPITACPRPVAHGLCRIEDFLRLLGE